MVMRDGQFWDTEREDGQECLVLEQEAAFKYAASRGQLPRPTSEVGERLVRPCRGNRRGAAGSERDD
jgi:hypothetical protein